MWSLETPLRGTQVTAQVRGPEETRWQPCHSGPWSRPPEQNHTLAGMGTLTRSLGREGHGKEMIRSLLGHQGVLTAVLCCKAGGGPGLNSRTLTTQNTALADTHACSGATTMAGSGAFYHNVGKKIKKQ